jgi:hypothetical protein
MADFKYMAVRPTSDNTITEEIHRKLRFMECLLSFGSGFLASHLMSRIAHIEGHQINYSSSVCWFVGHVCEIWCVKHRWLVSIAGRTHHSEAIHDLF